MQHGEMLALRRRSLRYTPVPQQLHHTAVLVVPGTLHQRHTPMPLDRGIGSLFQKQLHHVGEIVAHRFVDGGADGFSSAASVHGRVPSVALVDIGGVLVDQHAGEADRLLLSLRVSCQVGEEAGAFDGGAAVEEREDDALLLRPDGGFFCVESTVVAELIADAEAVAGDGEEGVGVVVFLVLVMFNE